MKVKLVLRRIHTYLGLLLLLFFLKFAASAILFAHRPIFNKFFNDPPQWETRFERDYEITVPEDAGPEELREIGSTILADLDMEGSFGAWRAGRDRIAVHKFTFGNNTRILYDMIEKKLIVEDQTFRLDTFLGKFHWIGGYQQDRFMNDLFALFIDLTCVAVIFWVVTGLVMWWQVPSARKWGIAALAGGWLTFLLFVFML